MIAAAVATIGAESAATAATDALDWILASDAPRARAARTQLADDLVAAGVAALEAELALERDEQQQHQQQQQQQQRENEQRGAARAPQSRARAPPSRGSAAAGLPGGEEATMSDEGVHGGEAAAAATAQSAADEAADAAADADAEADAAGDGEAGSARGEALQGLFSPQLVSDVGGAIRDEPRVWGALAVRVAARADVRDFAVDVLTRVRHRTGWRAPAAAVVAASRALRRSGL